jgi:predicted nucleic acid-binding protein
MNVLLLDTNVVSILFNRNHPLRQTCTDAVAGRQLVISFMTRAELWLWPAANNWGAARRAALAEHTALYLTLYPDERTCAIWAAVVDQCRRAGHPIQAADAWIAASARQWGCPLVTTDFRDYDAVEDLDVVPIR